MNPLGDAPEAASSLEQRLTMTLLSLAREVWVTRDRQRALEVLLATGGILDSGAVDRLQPTATEQAAIDLQCQAFLATILRSLLGDGGA